MAGFFSGTGSYVEMGRVNRALYNNGIPPGFEINLRARLGAYYGFGGSANIGLSNTFAGRYYPYTY
jgi:hypothetical protein